MFLCVLRFIDSILVKIAPYPLALRLGKLFSRIIIIKSINFILILFDDFLAQSIVNKNFGPFFGLLKL